MSEYFAQRERELVKKKNEAWDAYMNCGFLDFISGREKAYKDEYERLCKEIDEIHHLRSLSE